MTAQHKLKKHEKNMLKKLINECKGNVTVEINTHKDIYESVANYLREEVDEISEEILNIMIEKDTIIRIIFYPRTPLTYYSVYHYDLDIALEEALKVVEEIKTYY